MKCLIKATLAEVLMDAVNKHEILKWIFRSSINPVHSQLLEELKKISNTQTLTLEALSRLLQYEGGLETHLEYQKLPPDLFPNHPEYESYLLDPCKSYFSWTEEDCKKCMNRDDLTPHLLSIKSKPFSINPDFQTPENLNLRLSSVLGSISQGELWASIWTNSATSDFDSYESVLCAWAPNEIANFIQEVFKKIGSRRNEAFKKLCFHLKEHYIIFDENVKHELKTAWLNLENHSDFNEEELRVGEVFLFSIILQDMDSHEQLNALVHRPTNAKNYLFLTRHFKILERDSINFSNLISNQNSESLSRILWFLSSVKHSLPQKSVLHLVSQCLKSEDSLVRSSCLELVHKLKDKSSIKDFLQSSWSYREGNHQKENYWGSKILADFGTKLSFTDLKAKIESLYLGYAIFIRGCKTDEVIDFCNMINQELESLYSGNITDSIHDLPILEIRISNLDEINTIPYIHTSSKNFDFSVNFTSSDYSWGGWHEESNEEKFGSISDEMEQEKRQKYYNVIENVIDTHSFLFAQVIPKKVFIKIFDQVPDQIDRWLNLLRPFPDQDKLTLKGFSLISSAFYESLCIALFEYSVEKALELYNILKLRELVPLLVNESTLISYIDYAFFQCPDTNPVITSEWQKRIESCQSDLELLNIVITAQTGNASTWLQHYAEQNIYCDSPRSFCQATTILGFLENPNGSAVLKKLEESQPPTWRRDLVKFSHDNWQRNAWAKHWFSLFLEEKDNVLAWRSFRLCLECVDSRFWTWKDSIISQKLSDIQPKRITFLEDNIDTLRNKIKKNEKKLGENLFGLKILNRQVWPWI